MISNPTIFVVDDDKTIHVQIKAVAHLIGIDTKAYLSPTTFLQEYRPDQAGCLVLDFLFPDTNGMIFYKQLQTQGIFLPVIMLTGNAEVSTAVEALKEGIFDFIEKPVTRNHLVVSVQKAIEHDKQIRRQIYLRQAWVKQLETLTQKEFDVLMGVLAGNTNKEIARDLNISPKTVDKHRLVLMRKLHVRNQFELLCVAYWCELIPPCREIISRLDPFLSQ